jgi:hypothetical protein
MRVFLCGLITAGSTFHGDEPILQQAPNDNGDEPVSLQDGKYFVIYM